MTIKEITEMRKAGRLDEALAAAEAEFNRNANKFTSSALFWCLNDLYRKQSPEYAAITIARMETIWNDHNPDDGYMAKALAGIARRTLPHYSEVKEAAEKSKNGEDPVGCYRKVKGLYDADELDASLFPYFGWIIYNALKHTDIADVRMRKQMLNSYLKLKPEAPSRLHSLILSEAIKVEQNTPIQFRIRDFVRLWDLKNLREEDWEQYRNEQGNRFPSTVEKLIGVYAKELKADRIAAPQEFIDLLDKALEKYPDNQNLPYHKARLLLSQGRQEEALSYLRDLILKYPSKYYLWHQASKLIDDPDTRLGLLSKALTLRADEKFLGDLRLSMASLLIDKGDLSHARFQLDRYREAREANGWGIKSDYRLLFNRVQTVAPAQDIRRVYDLYAKAADEFIYSHLPKLFAVKVAEKLIDDNNRPGRKISLWSIKTAERVYSVKRPEKFGLDRNLRIGTPFQVRLHDNKIVWIRQADSIPELDWAKEFSGTARLRTDRKGRRYAIIDGCYIGDRLLSDIEDGFPLIVLALRQDDGRWIAIGRR